MNLNFAFRPKLIDFLKGCNRRDVGGLLTAALAVFLLPAMALP